MEIKGWSNFIRGINGASAEKILNTVNSCHHLKVTDSKFSGDSVIIMKESDLKKLKDSHKMDIREFLDRHLNIVDKLLEIKTNKDK